MDIIFILFGLFVILFGVLQMNKEYIEWIIKVNNSFLGVKTKITKETIYFRKFAGVASILVGLYVVFYGLV
jgi:hypothetical protein